MATAFRWGGVCSSCTSGCRDKPSDREPLLIVCTACGGKDEKCERCKGFGTERITGCPKEIIDRQTWRLLELSDFADKGAFPVTGGVLEQSDSFLSGCRMVWGETKYWKAKNRTTE